jgi:hypothetical protein
MVAAESAATTIQRAWRKFCSTAGSTASLVVAMKACGLEAKESFEPLAASLQAPRTLATCTRCGERVCESVLCEE